MLVWLCLIFCSKNVCWSLFKLPEKPQDPFTHTTKLTKNSKAIISFAVLFPKSEAYCQSSEIFHIINIHSCRNQGGKGDTCPCPSCSYMPRSLEALFNTRVHHKIRFLTRYNVPESVKQLHFRREAHTTSYLFSSVQLLCEMMSKRNILVCRHAK